MAQDDRKSLMRSLGEFVGHVRMGLRTKVDAPGVDRVSRRDTTEAASPGPDGSTIIVRRTVIEEVEVQAKESRS